VVNLLGFHRRIAVEHGAAGLRDPAGKPLAHRNLQRREEPEAFAVDVFRMQPSLAADIHRDGIEWHHPLESCGDHRKRFIQAERTAQVLRQFEKQLRFQAGGHDGIQEFELLGARRNGRPGHLEARIRGIAAFYHQVGGEPRHRSVLARGLLFKLHIASLQELHHNGVEALAGQFSDFSHRLVQRQGAPILPVRRQRVQAVDGRKNARPDRNFRALQAVGITAAIPLLMMRADDGHHRIREFHALQNLCAHHRMNLHLLELLRRQLAGLGDDVFGDGQLADVVQQRGGA